MAASPAGIRRDRGLLVGLLVVPVVLELAAVAVALSWMPDLAGRLPLGAGPAVGIAIAGIAAAIGGGVLARRETATGIRRAAAAVLGVTAGLTVLLGVWLATGGVLAVFGVLMGHAAIAVGVLAVVVARSSAGAR